MKFLILTLLVCSNAFAGYMTKVDIEDCSKVGRRVHVGQSTCLGECVRIPSDYVCETFSEQDTDVNDIESPIFSKSETEACSDRSECEALNTSKICTDGDERVIMAGNFSEIYCSKLSGYNQKTVKAYREDSVKKAANDSLRAEKLAAQALRRSRIKGSEDLMEVLRSPGALTPVQIKTLLLGIMEKIEE